MSEKLIESVVTVSRTYHAVVTQTINVKVRKPEGTSKYLIRSAAVNLVSAQLDAGNEVSWGAETWEEKIYPPPIIDTPADETPEVPSND